MRSQAIANVRPLRLRVTSSFLTTSAMFDLHDNKLHVHFARRGKCIHSLQFILLKMLDGIEY